MNSLTELNQVAAQTFEYTDLRPAGIKTDREPPLGPIDQIGTIPSSLNAIIVNPAPGLNITEVINYSTANVRYRVKIVTGGSPLLTGSTISWPLGIPAGLTLSQVASTYTISGIKSVKDWNQIKTFNWNLPGTRDSSPLWFLEVAILYYDAAAGEERVIDWEVYDNRYYWVSKMDSAVTMVTNGVRAKLHSAALTASTSLWCPGSKVKLANANLTASTTLIANIVDAPLNANFTLTGTGLRKKPLSASIASSASVYAKPYFAPLNFDVNVLSTTGNIGMILNGSGTLNVTWGDGTFNNYTLTSEDQVINHTFVSTGVKTVTFNSGNLTRFNVSGTSNARIIAMNSWGEPDSNLQDLSGAFTNAIYLTKAPSYLPQNVTTLNGAFQGCTAFNSSNIIVWNTSNVTDMSYMFSGATAFNQNISSWNTSKVTTMVSMFSGATAFNQNISSWDTSKVTNMNNMFQNATAFNQNLRAWDVPLIATKPSNFDFGTTAWYLGTAKTLTNNNVTLSSAQTRFGYNTMLFPASSPYGYIDTPVSSDFMFGTGDFTLELWFYRISGTLDRELINLGRTIGEYGPVIRQGSNGFNYGINEYTYVHQDTRVASLNQWYHLALVRNAGKVKFYLNGVAGVEENDTTNFSTNRPTRIGDSDGWNGYMTDIRISNVARYTSNFSVPTFMSDRDASTKLLINNGSISDNIYYGRPVWGTLGV